MNNALNFKPNYRSKMPRTDHDLSQTFGFSSSSGMILPVYQDFLNAGETEYYSGNLFSRTQPLVTAAMADVDVYLDWFFVPLQVLYLNAGSLRWQTNDFISSALDGIDSYGYFPLVDINDCADVFYEYGMEALLSDVFSDGLDDRFDSVGVSTFRLFNHLGFNPYGVFHGYADDYTFQHDPVNPKVFPMFALAYQAIYQDYFRVPLDDRIKRNVRSFNLDNVTPGGSGLSSDTNGIFELRYRPLHFDYFMSVKPSPVIADVNLAGEVTAFRSLSQIDNYLLGDVGLANPNNPSFTSADDPSVTQYVSNDVNQPTISTANIRSMFALEKLLRITGRTKKDYDSQVLAHLGFDVPHDVKHQITHLGKDHALLHIGEVTSLADTFDGDAGAALGSLSGKGYVNIQGKKRKFTAPTDGVIMCTYSCVPRFRYHGTFDKQNAVSKWLDLYVPEYDKLGMQPLYVYEAECGVAGTSSNRCGWQYRYEQWKRKYDRVTEAFLSPVYENQVNQYSAWMLSRLPYGQNESIISYDLTPSDFLCPPTALNNIMVMPYVTQWSDDYFESPWLMFARDPFINEFAANVKKVSTMSKYGEPSLDD